MPRPRVAIVDDFLQEQWPSMELVATMLTTFLKQDHSSIADVTRISPTMRWRFSLISSQSSGLVNADRFCNRFWDYPKLMRLKRQAYDLFHIVDHSYSQLAHELPAERTLITCHDLDAFRCLLEPSREPRSFLFNRMTGRVLNGFRKARWITCDSAATCEELLRYALVVPERVTVVHNGVHPTCKPKPDPPCDAQATELLGSHRPDSVEILHVGSTIPRKRIDVLLEILASVRKEVPHARLIRVGGAFTAEQTRLLNRLKLHNSIQVLPFIDRPVLAAVYRRAAMVLLPSEREGFGLPVVEAMACGTPVVASDIPALHEVGGEAATYCGMRDVSTWSRSIIELLCERAEQPEKWAGRRAAGIAQASQFTWAEYARKMVTVYKEVLASAA
jgi:glycosyltransferase involved in cell wall biosynthesis